MEKFNGWLNIFKPQGISSAKAVSLIKKTLSATNNNIKVGHAGTLDLEASGVLPIGIGEATKLMSFLVNSKKTYIFTIKFGARTDTGDFSGKVLDYTNYIPTKTECLKITNKFLGEIEQTPNIYSAIKVNGVRSYTLARQGIEAKLSPRIIKIYSLDLINFDAYNVTATYITTCSKGTYIRSLAEDIALCLQSLAFVLELRRTMVGIFKEADSINILGLEKKPFVEIQQLFEKNKVKVEAILSDILVLEATELQARQIKYGQQCIVFDQINFVSFINSAQSPITNSVDCRLKKIERTILADINKVKSAYGKYTDLIAVAYKGSLLAIGKLENNYFNSFRVFNLI